MSKEQKPDTDQHQFWQMVLETFKSSGLSVRQFCQKEGLSEASFYTWRKKLTKSDESAEDEQKNASSSAFIEVSMPKNDPAALELVLSSGNTLRISSGADSTTLNDVISVLKQVGLC